MSFDERFELATADGGSLPWERSIFWDRGPRR